MKDKKKLLSWREAFRIQHRAFKIILGQCPQMAISGFVSTVWSALTPYMGIYLSALIIGELAGERNVARLRTLVLITLLSAAVISLISALLAKWRDVYGPGTSKFFQFEKIYANKLLDMDFATVDDYETHKLLSAIRQNQNSGGWGLLKVLDYYNKLLSSVLTILGGIAMTVALFTSKVPEDAGAYTVLNNPLFILLIVGVMLAITYLAPALSNKAGAYRMRVVDANKHSNRFLAWWIGISSKAEVSTDVRMYRQDIMAEKHLGDKTYTFCSKGIYAKLAKGPVGLFHAASSAVSVVFTGVAYLFVALKAWAGAFGIGSVTQYVSSITRVSGGVSSLISTAGDIRNNAPFVKLVLDFLDTPNPMYQGCLTVEKRRDRDYEVEFKNVSFRYPGSESYALRNVNMKFRIGERLAVVGMNGSGKTTFIKLLCRLYDPTEGEIRLNGIDIRKYNYLDYMMIFSVVFQDFKLFSFPLGENVAAGMNYDKERVIDCLHKVGFGERLAEMPKEIDTYLNKDCDKDGVTISGGEAQKIAIARALYKDAPFIILDEPTAALDPIAEAEIYSKFNEIVGDKTAIYISHRLSSCKFCDEILVFHEGGVVQQGTHEALLSDEAGKYYKLWNAQAQYYTK